MFYCFIVTAAWLVWHIGFRIRVIGRENLPKEGGFVLAPNHISAIDQVFVVVARFWGKRLLIMAKEEILQVNPVFTWMFRHVGVVGIERGRGDVNVVDELIGDVQKGQGLLIFPEGTRSKTGQVGKVKSGAFVIARPHEGVLPGAGVLWRAHSRRGAVSGRDEERLDPAQKQGAAHRCLAATVRREQVQLRRAPWRSCLQKPPGSALAWTVR